MCTPWHAGCRDAPHVGLSGQFAALLKRLHGPPISGTHQPALRMMQSDCVYYVTMLLHHVHCYLEAETALSPADADKTQDMSALSIHKLAARSVQSMLDYGSSPAMVSVMWPIRM